MRKFFIFLFLLFLFSSKSFAKIIKLDKCLSINSKSENYIYKSFSVNFNTGTVKQSFEKGGGSFIFNIIYYDDEWIFAVRKEDIAKVEIDINLIRKDILSTITFIDDMRVPDLLRCANSNQNEKKEIINNEKKRSKSGIKELLKKLY